MAMVVSHSNREKNKLVLTAPRANETGVGGGSGYRQLMFDQVRHNPSRHICDQDKFTREKINLVIY